MDARPRELHLLFRAYKVSSVDCVNNGLEHIAVRAEIFFSELTVRTSLAIAFL